jgi:hypothetical protein
LLRTEGEAGKDVGREGGTGKPGILKNQAVLQQIPGMKSQKVSVSGCNITFYG